MLEAIQSLDGAILLAIQNIRLDFLNPVVEFYTSLGNVGFLWIALSLILLLNRKTRKAGFFSLVAMLFGMICTNMVLKHLVGRTRPWLVVEGLTALVNEPDPNSFPSGHTCAAFAAAVTWWKLLPHKWAGITGLVMAVCMGLSRLYVGVHFPTDVIMGAVVGSLCAWAALKLAQYYTWKHGAL